MLKTYTIHRRQGGKFPLTLFREILSNVIYNIYDWQLADKKVYPQATLMELRRRIYAPGAFKCTEHAAQLNLSVSDQAQHITTYYWRRAFMMALLHRDWFPIYLPMASNTIPTNLFKKWRGYTDLILKIRDVEDYGPFANPLAFNHPEHLKDPRAPKRQVALDLWVSDRYDWHQMRADTDNDGHFDNDEGMNQATHYCRPYIDETEENLKLKRDKDRFYQMKCYHRKQADLHLNRQGMKDDLNTLHLNFYIIEHTMTRNGRRVVESKPILPYELLTYPHIFPMDVHASQLPLLKPAFSVEIPGGSPKDWKEWGKHLLSLPEEERKALDCTVPVRLKTIVPKHFVTKGCNTLVHQLVSKYEVSTGKEF